MAKLERSALLHYIAVNAGDTPETMFLIGKDVQDMSITLNAETESNKNILDEVSVVDNGYKPSTDVDTYYADPDDGAFYDWLKNITMNRLTNDACKAQILEVLIDKDTGPFDGWMEDIIVKPSSYGGGAGGVRIPYSITFCGNRKAGTVTIADKVPTFTETTEES